MLLSRSLAALLAVAVAAVAPAWAGDRTNVPLKNWGGFAEYRDRVYDDLELLALAGLTDRFLFSTKPMSRLEIARIVAGVVERIRSDTGGRYGDRRYAEPVLDRLIDEFRTELASLGVRIGHEPLPEPRFFTFTGIDRAQVRAGWLSEPYAMVNAQGQRLKEGFNGGPTFESRAQVGDFLTVYVQPEVVANQDFLQARLATGYAKLTLYNVELLVGRDSLWWGPALHGSLMFSSNGPPLDQVRLGAAEAFELPWIGEWVGPTKIMGFLAQMEKARDHPRAKIAGMRGTIAPFTWLELGVSRSVMFDGTDDPEPSLSDWPEIIFDPPTGDDRINQPEKRNNQLGSIDASIRLANLDRYGLPFRGLHLYGEFGWDDTCCNDIFVPDTDAVSWLVGALVTAPFGLEGVTARFEYAESSIFSFTHDQFTSGWASRDQVLSHVIGTDGRDVFFRLTTELTPRLMLALEASYTNVGPTQKVSPGAHEKRTGGAIELSYALLENLHLFAQYRGMHRENRNFDAGDDGFDHVLRVELTRFFR